jgi:cysteine-rich repeat protein
MQTVLRLLACGTLLLWPAAARADVPLGGPAAATFGPARLDVVAAGVGLGTQPASLSVTVPAGAAVQAAWFYVTGRGAGDGEVLLNGMATALPLVATSGPLVFDPGESMETRRLALTLGPGTSTFTIAGYDQLQPGGAFVVAVVSHPAAPLRTVTVREGADFAFHDFAPPFGPDTEATAFSFAASASPRAARLLIFTHDTRPDRGDATWVLAAAAGATPLPADLVGGTGGAERVQRDRLGVPAADGGFARGAQLDVFDREVAVPAGADYLAFQIESAANDLSGPDSLGLSVAVLSLPAPTAGDPDDPGGPGGPGGEIPANCGDGVLQNGEECDDGNRVAGDGCDAACAAEDTAETWKLSLRVRPSGVERLRYYTTLRALPSALLGAAPVRIALSGRGFRMAEFEMPPTAFRVRPRPVLAQPDGRLAEGAGTFGDWKVRTVFKPVTGRPEYTLKLVVEGEMLPEMFGVLHLTADIRVGSATYRATDPVRANRTGRFLRYIHPPLRDR